MVDLSFFLLLVLLLAGMEAMCSCGVYPELGQAWWKKKAAAFLATIAENRVVIATIRYLQLLIWQ